MTLYCVHKPHPFTLSQIFHKQGGETELVPGVMRCDRCLTSWNDGEPEPKVAIGLIE